MYLTDRVGHIIYRCTSADDGRQFLYNIKNIQDRDIILWDGERLLGYYRYYLEKWIFFSVG